MNNLLNQNLILRGKKVLLRVDLNVPMKNGAITETSRIEKILPTIKLLIKKEAKIIILSHIGRPNGRVINEMSLEPISKKLSEFLNKEVLFDKNQINENTIADDNIEVVKKLDSNYIPVTYPIKKRDKNFLILETELKNSKVFIKTSSSPKKIEINLSDMNFFNVSNQAKFQHYKNLFKIMLKDLFFKVPDQKLKNLI